jgi:ribosomal protein S27AE
MWASSIPKTIEKKKTPAATLPLEKYLANARLEFQEQRKEIPKLLREVQTLKKKTEAMTHRYQIRIVKDTQLHIKELEKEVEIRQSMQRENEYEHIIAPYLNAYNQRVEISQAKNDIPRNITAPGCGKKKETIDSYVQQYDATATRQNAIVNEYLMQVSDESPKLALHTRDDCPLCNETLMLINSKAIMTCPKCGYSVTYLDATMSSMSYSDDVEFSSFSYKRINHFNEWLQQVQAKENFEITDEIMENIMNELFKQRITNKSQITQKKVREVLKTLKLRKAYEHVAQITCKLAGTKPMRIPAEAEETCRLMFIAVQPAFEKHCPKDRKNFLSYSYCLYKFFQLLGYDQFLESFSLLKGRDKLTKQDEIFKKICEELDWECL